MRLNHIRRIDALREADRQKLGIDFTIEGSIEFDKVFERQQPKSDFVLITNRHEVTFAYYKMTNYKFHNPIQQ
jgi:hypothetical protein